MAITLPPPKDDPRFNDWLYQFWKQENTPVSGIVETNHAALGNLNSTSYTHLTAIQAADLTDGGDSSLHAHAFDRDRANHVGAQPASTISDFNPAVQVLVNQPLFVVRAANMQSTADQAMTKMRNFTNWLPTKIVGVRVSGGTTVACSGGIYTAAAKGGTAIVAAGQSWLAVTGALGYADATIAALTVALTATPIFSLTTGSTAACTADIFIFGITLD